MEVTYFENGKYAFFNGVKFTKDKKTGYYLSTTKINDSRERLHVVVWEYYNCPVPHGYHVHHVNGDKNNNDISNLKLITAKEHLELHGKELTAEQREWRRNNVIANAIPKAIEWSKTEEASKINKAKARKLWDNKQPEKYICTYCGKEFESLKSFSKGRNKFCSDTCKSAWRRKSGIDNEIRVCEVCGCEFSVNKYRKTSICSRHCAMVKRHKEANGKHL